LIKVRIALSISPFAHLSSFGTSAALITNPRVVAGIKSGFTVSIGDINSQEVADNRYTGISPEAVSVLAALRSSHNFAGSDCIGFCTVTPLYLNAHSSKAVLFD
jgi:hypothetical protein